MSDRTLELPAAPSELSALISDASAHGEIVLTRDGIAVAKIVPISSLADFPPAKKCARTYGSAKGLGFVPDDFNAPLEDMKEYM